MALPRSASVWLPLPALFLTYHFAGWVARAMARPSADALLIGWDRTLFGVDPGVWLVHHLPAAGLSVFELFYASYYLLLVAAPTVLLARSGLRAAWRLWITAALAFLICYALFPWFPSTPPRLLFRDFAYGGATQELNLWVLNLFSVHANVFPSAHVAAAFSFASYHFRLDSRMGRLFLIWAFGIGIATVSGGYHYGVDAVGGAAAGLLGDWIASRFTGDGAKL